MVKSEPMASPHVVVELERAGLIAGLASGRPPRLHIGVMEVGRAQCGIGGGVKGFERDATSEPVVTDTPVSHFTERRQRCLPDSLN